MSSFDSVLLIAFGGPEQPEDVRPFLRIVTEGRPVPAERMEAVAHHYDAIGGRSPLNELTRRQAEALRTVLAREGITIPVYVGMRNWHPFLHETLAQMAAERRQRALGVILSSFQTEASWDRYVGDVDTARQKVGVDAPDVLYAPAWADHPFYIEAMVDRAAVALARIPSDQRQQAHLLFTAHSVPVTMAQGTPYVSQVESAGRRIAARLNHSQWSVAYQSRSGSPRELWLEPDIADALRALAKNGVEDVVVAPVGFVCDHVEVLYDLDVEARGLADELGVGFHRAATANDHPRFIAMLADLVRRARAGP